MLKKSAALATCGEMIRTMPNAASQAIERDFLVFVGKFVSLVNGMPDGECLVAPGGWLRPESTHLLLYILRNEGNDK